MNRKTGAIFSYLLMAVEMLSSLLFTPLLIRSLGKAEYGTYSWVMSITAYLYLLDLGIGNSIVKYAAQYRIQENEKKQRNFLGLITIYYLVIGVILIGIGMILENNFSLILRKGFENSEIEMAKRLFWMTVLNAAATLFFGAYQKILLAYERFVLTKSLDILKVFLRMVLGLAVLFGGGNSYGIVIVNLGVTIVVGFFSMAAVFWKLKLLPSVKDMEMGFVKEIVGFSSIVLIQMIATQLNSMVDQFLLGVLVPSATLILAVYGTGILIPQYVQSIAANMNGVLMPGVVRMIQEKRDTGYIENEMIRISRILFILLSFIGVAFGVYGRLFFDLWVGEGYEQSYWVAMLILIPQIFILSQSIGSQILWALNKHKVQGYLKLSIAVANVGLSIVLIRWNPLLGATIATAMTLILGDILAANYVFKRYIHISIKRYYIEMLRGIWVCLLVAGVVGIAIRFIVPANWFGLIMGCGIMGCVYAGMMWKIGASQYEKTLILGILQKLRIH